MKFEIRGTYGTMYYVKDMDKAVRYYKENLGLKTRYESSDWTEFDLNGHGLCLHALDSEAMKKQPSQEQGVLIVDVKGLTPMVETLKKKGVEFVSEIKEVHPGAYCADFKDPSGNVVSLYENTQAHEHGEGCCAH